MVLSRMVRTAMAAMYINYYVPALHFLTILELGLFEVLDAHYYHDLVLQAGFLRGLRGRFC